MISENIGKEKNSLYLRSAHEWHLSLGLPEDISATIWEEPAGGWCQNQRKERWEAEKFPVILSESLDPAEPEANGTSKLLGSFPQSVSQFSCSVMSNSLWPRGPGLPVHHQLPEFTQTHIHWIGDAIQPSHPLSSPSPPAFNLCQHQGLFKWVSSSHQVAKVLEFQLQHQSFRWTLRTDFL